MKYKKICPNCQSNFLTDKKAKKFCRSRCAVNYRNKKKNTERKVLCQWCGQIFSFVRVKKFCSQECRSAYMQKLGLHYKRVDKIPVKITLIDADRRSKSEGITYGTFMRKYRIK